MRFARLLESAQISGCRRHRGDPQIVGVASDSRRCRRGDCFVAVRGPDDDGHRYILPAVAAGCAAVVCQDPGHVPPGVAYATVDDSRTAAGLLAQAIRNWPCRKLTCVGITGTNGKSTVAHIVRAILCEAGYSVGLLGTIRYDTGLRNIPAVTTTPGAVELAEMTQEMVDHGRTHLVMEVSSHALDQSRTSGLEFRVAVFTNLTQDHLDYHETMDRYREAKLKMFRQLKGDSSVVVNRDDPAGPAFADAATGHVLWYGLSPAADIWAKIERIDAAGTRFVLAGGEDQISLGTSLIGRHNVYNCLAAAAAASQLGVDLATTAAAIESVRCVPGRLQRIPVDAPYEVFVDYAHTADALANVLGSLRPLTRGRIILVFGCGGDRDRTKRPQMAKVAQDLSDRMVITSDNPRSEQPESIIDQVVAGLAERGRRRAVIEPDRRAAIGLAVEQASDGDVVLIAGKGHENYQLVGERRLEFDDVEVAAEMVGREVGA